MGKTCTEILIFCLFTVCSKIIGSPRYQREYEYSVIRENLEEREKRLANNNLVLSEVSECFI